MNTVYTMVWSESKAMWVPAPEITRRKGKQSRRSLGRRGLRALTLSAGVALGAPSLAFADPSATQLPTGGSVAAGAATITQNNAAMVINQSSNRAAIDWQSFNVGRDASVHFNQPNATSATLNRVLDSNPSQIFGQITAPGQVFLSNPNGVYFSPSASVDVGALTATTHRIGLDDFMSGNLNFERDGATGSVINEGTLEAALGGYIALLAPEVRNEGVVIAQAGAVVMAAGEQINLQFSDGHLAGVTVSKSDIDAIVENKHAVLAPEGLIILSAQAASNLRGGVVNNEGSIEAGGITRDGGRIYLEASDRITHSGAIDADGSATGDGGVVILMADLKNADSVTTVSGSITAQGGEFGGDGGFVETSGAKINFSSDLLIDVSSESGIGGTWLIDPNNISIVDDNTAEANLNSNSAPSYTTSDDSTILRASTIVAQLNAGTSVIVETSASGTNSQDGDITVSSAINKTAGGAASLTLKAHNSIEVSADITSTSNQLNLVLWSDSDGNGSGRVRTQNAITTNGGGLWIGGGYGTNTSAATSWTPYSGAANITVGDGYAIASSTMAKEYGVWLDSGAINTSGGNVAIYGWSDHAVGLGSRGISMDGQSTTSMDSGAGTIYLEGRSKTDSTIADNFGVFVGGTINTTGGITIHSLDDITIRETITANQAEIRYGQSTTDGIIDSETSTYDFGLSSTGFAGQIDLPAGDNFTTKLGSSSASTTWTVITNLGVAADAATQPSTMTLQGLRALSNPKGNYVLGANIDASATSTWNAASGAVYTYDPSTNSINGAGIGYYGFLPIAGPTNNDGSFRGKFDGLGHTVSNLTVNSSWYRSSLFGTTDFNAVIQNIGVINSDIYGSNNVGAIAGYSEFTTFKNVYSTANIYGDGALGGLVGYLDDPTTSYNASSITSSFSTGIVKSRATNWSYGNAVGGLVGSVDGISLSRLIYVTDSYHTNGTVTGLWYVGGLIGYANQTNISGAYATGTVGGNGDQTLEVGGLVGSLHRSYLSTSYFNGTVDVDASSTAQSIGGLVGELGNSEIDKVYSLGTVINRSSATNRYIGGLIGFNTSDTDPDFTNTTISNAYSRSNVTGGAYVGGIAGKNSSSNSARLELSNSYFSGTITATSNYGGLIGTFGYADISSSYFDKENISASLTMSDDASYGVSQASMQANNLYLTAGWGLTLDSALGTDYPILDFSNASNPWKIYGTFIPVTYTLSDVTSGYTYNGSSQLPSIWTSNSIFGGSYDSWVLGTDYHLVSGGQNVTGFTDADTYSSLTVNVVKTGYDEIASGSTSGSFVIGQKDITAITGITASNKVYNGDATATLVTSAASFSGKVTNDTLTVATATGAFADKTVATGKTVTISGLTLGGADAANYHLVDTTASTRADITAKSISAITGITASNKVYDGDATATLVTSAASFSGKVTNDTLTVATATGAFADKTVATGKTVTISGLTLGGADASNYSLASTTASTTANITAKSVTVAYSATDKIYDGTNSASVTEATSDLISGDVVTISETASFSNVNAGSNRQVNVSGISLAGADAGNYSLAGTTAITYADIIKAPLQVTALAAGVRTYDGTAYSGGAGVSYVGFVPGDTAADLGGTLSYGGDSQGAVNAGDYVITPSGLTSDNYFIFFYNAGLRINPAAVTVSGITASNKTYDGSLAASLDTSGITLSGMVAGDDLSLASATGSFADANVGSGKTVTISSITLGGNDVSNYGLTSATASTTANITAKPLSLSITKVYDKTPNIEVEDISFSGVVNGDTTPSIQQSGVVGTSSQTAVGSISDFTDTVGITLNNGSNYTLTGSTVSGNVLPKPVFISTASATKNFGEADPAFTYSVMLNSLLSGDSLTGSVGRVAGEGGGTYLINDVTGLTNANYTVVVGNAGTLTIRRPVEVLPPRIQAAVQTMTTPDVRADVVNTQSVSVTLETALAPNTSGPGAVQVSSVSTQAEPMVEPIQLASQDVGPAVVAQENEAQAAQVAAEVAPTAPANTVAETQSSAVTTERVVEETPAQTRTQEVSGSEPVQTAEGAAAENEGIVLPETEVVTVSVPKSMTTSGTGFSFELPIELQSTLTTGQPSANLLDGSPLPSWIKFVPATASFEVGAVPDSGLPIQIVVGNAMTTALVIVSEQ